MIEYIEGIKITDREGLERAGISPHDVARLLNYLYADQMLHLGILHADPRPGDLLASRTPPGAARPRAHCFLGALARQVTEQISASADRRRFRGVCEAMARPLRLRARGGGRHCHPLEPSRSVARSRTRRNCGGMLMLSVPRNAVCEDVIAGPPADLLMVGRAPSRCSTASRSNLIRASISSNSPLAMPRRAVKWRTRCVSRPHKNSLLQMFKRVTGGPPQSTRLLRRSFLSRQSLIL